MAIEVLRLAVVDRQAAVEKRSAEIIAVFYFDGLFLKMDFRHVG